MPSEGPLFRCASENLRVTQPASQDNARSQSCACSLRFRLQSQCGIVMLPLLLQIRHERNKPWILSQVVQVSVTLEKWIAREAFIGGYLPALIIRIALEELLNYRGSLLVPPQPE